MNTPLDLIKAIRSGQLADVVAVLDAGVPVELNDGQGVPGLPLGIACFMGHADIVRELVKRGAKVNLPDNNDPTSPLSMAVRGKRTEIVKLLTELGALVPPGMETGLSAQDLAVARLIASSVESAEPGQPLDNTTVIEEIVMPRAFGTDTMVLEADVLRAAKEMEAKRKEREGK